MAGLSELLEIARRGLAAQRLGINVTSHNVANASTPGFSRQRVQLTATPPQRNTVGLLGTGVTVAQVGRIRDRFLDHQTWATSSQLGSAETEYRLLQQVEAVLNEPSETGLGATMAKFFNSFLTLAARPEESAARNAVLQQGTLLAQSFHVLQRSLAQLQSDIARDASVRVERINTLTGEISRLDIEITNAIATGLDPSDAKDRRDLLLTELSKLTDLKISEDDSGSVMVSIGGSVVASRAGSVPLSLTTTGGQITITNPASGKSVRVTGGELGALLEINNTRIADYLTKLNDIASTLIDRVNTLHRSGYGLGLPPSTGVSFFVGNSAETIAVNTDLVNDSSKVAASADGSPGNNAIALAIARVADEPLLASGTVSIPDYYNGLVSSVGTALVAANSTASSRQLILTQLENQQASVSGVSLDEEMVNLVKYQRAFEASARIITSVDEMFQTIIRMV